MDFYITVIIGTLSLLLGFALGKIYQYEQHNKDNRALHEEIGMLRMSLNVSPNLHNLGLAIKNCDGEIKKLFQ